MPPGNRLESNSYSVCTTPPYRTVPYTDLNILCQSSLVTSFLFCYRVVLFGDKM